MAKQQKTKAIWQWKAPAFPYYKKGGSWTLIVGIIALALVIVFILIEYYLAAVVIALSAIVLHRQAHEKPSSKSYEIFPEGIKLDDRFYPFENFKSFLMIPCENGSTLHLESARRFALPLIIHLDEKNIDQVYQIISQIIPENSTKSFDFGDQMIKWMRL